MNNKQQELTTTILRATPPTIGALFGNFLTRAISLVDLAGQGWQFLIKRNKEDLEEFWREVDMYFAIDDARKSAENIQFLREWVIKIAVETREEKRKRLLNVAINYHKKDNPFDEKLAFLNLLDKMSEEELVFLLKIYKIKNNIIDAKFLTSREKSLVDVLAGYGLLHRDIESINRPLEKIGETFEQMKKELLNPSIPYDYTFDKPRLEYEETEFGKRFVNFIQREAKNEN